MASKSGETAPALAKVGSEPWITRASGKPEPGAPRTEATPSTISTSAGAASSSAAAASASLSRTLPAATWMELPALTALRLAKVPMPKGMAAVSPPTTVTQSSGTPRASAATWAKEVSCPCPWLQAPVATTARPDASIRTVAPS